MTVSSIGATQCGMRGWCRVLVDRVAPRDTRMEAVVVDFRHCRALTLNTIIKTIKDEYA
jgi:hypothetical protein